MASEMVEPLYEVGDKYSYSDGRVETVSRVGPERVFWETAEGSAYTSSRNFILPPIAWKSGSNTGENQILPSGGQKWPPAADRGRVDFRVVARSGSAPSPWLGPWRCVDDGARRVDVTLGVFNARVIRCDRAKPAPGTWKTRQWYFVAEIGHYVRRVESIHGTDRRVTVDLVAVQPGGKGWPPAARGGLDWAIQGALNDEGAGKTVEWRSSAVGAEFEIRVSEGEFDVRGTACRRYEIRRISPDQPRRFPAIACRSADDERWLTPGIDPDAIPPTAFSNP
jgi:hypothetical protein